MMSKSTQGGDGAGAVQLRNAITQRNILKSKKDEKLYGINLNYDAGSCSNHLLSQPQQAQNKEDLFSQESLWMPQSPLKEERSNSSLQRGVSPCIHRPKVSQLIPGVLFKTNIVELLCLISPCKPR
uniref:Uncharacterized protein n=1 Tax=Nelumbo nucifera TaxID=4432 RepID=A0A822ZWM9_NELNU|nr:TPA_asm: hypothetical protein HUJ06_017682 [Nelumbo nucifera]